MLYLSDRCARTRDKREDLSDKDVDCEERCLEWRLCTDGGQNNDDRRDAARQPNIRSGSLKWDTDPVTFYRSVLTSSRSPHRADTTR